MALAVPGGNEELHRSQEALRRLELPCFFAVLFLAVLFLAVLFLAVLFLAVLFLAVLFLLDDFFVPPSFDVKSSSALRVFSGVTEWVLPGLWPFAAHRGLECLQQVDHLLGGLLGVVG